MTLIVTKTAAHYYAPIVALGGVDIIYSFMCLPWYRVELVQVSKPSY